MLFRPSYVLLPIDHLQQRALGECLVACAAMLLGYYDIPYNYDRLVRLLRIQRPYGTAFSNIVELANQKIGVAYGQGTIAGLHAHLVNGDPCIASVQTGQLPYWNKLNTYHAVVVVGMSSDFVYLNDPAMPMAPLQVPLGDFDLAWLDQDEYYAVMAV